MSDFIVESMESTNNSPLAEEQGVARATAKLLRAERVRFRREMKEGKRNKRTKSKRKNEKRSKGNGAS